MEGLGSFNQSEQHKSERREAVANTLAEKLARLRAIPHVAQAIADSVAKKTLELERRGIPVAKPTKVLRPESSYPPVPKGPSVTHYSDVEQQELIPDGKGGLVRKDEL